MHKYPTPEFEAAPGDARIGALREIANAVRRQSLRLVHRAGAGHPGGDLSSADILAALYFGVLRIDPGHPDDPQRDRFILSKGHCSAALYATLAMAGFFPVDELATFIQAGPRLSGHPHRAELPGIEASTGPLGHGLPIAAGAALAAKIERASCRER